MSSYSANFYQRREQRVVASAAALVPVLVELLQPRSVIDVGCANGLWLEAFRNRGVLSLHGVDGRWAPRGKLDAAGVRFIEQDLASAPLPYQLAGAGARFDLLLSLELLEHLPERRADAMVDAMCALSDVLVVSAAVPHQGGTGHINEQWPDYWRQRFAARGFIACDFLRPACWNDARIAPWYRQNIIGYFRGSVPEGVREFALRHVARLVDEPLPLCHPGVFSYKLGKLRSTLRNPLAAGLTEIRKRWSLSRKVGN